MNRKTTLSQRSAFIILSSLAAALLDGHFEQPTYFPSSELRGRTSSASSIDTQDKPMVLFVQEP
jgi:hypothetical protein